mgnify:CR=1 FL=1
MSYTAERIDTEKFESALDNHKRYQEELKRTAVEKANAQYEGYCQCLEDVRSMLHCSNYEKTESEFERSAIDALDNLRYIIGFLPQNGKPKSLSEEVMKHVKKTCEGINQMLRQSYNNGVDNAFYEICKELDVQSQDIRDMNTGIDEKAALLTDRIKETICDETPGKINWVSVQESFPTVPKEKVAQGDREVEVLVWDGTELCKAFYLPSTKCFYDFSDLPINNVTHWAIFNPPKKEQPESVKDIVESEENSGVD